MPHTELFRKIRQRLPSAPKFASAAQSVGGVRLCVRVLREIQSAPVRRTRRLLTPSRDGGDVQKRFRFPLFPLRRDRLDAKCTVIARRGATGPVLIRDRSLRRPRTKKDVITGRCVCVRLMRPASRLAG